MNSVEFGDIIRKQRNKKKVTVRQLAEMVDVDHSHIVRIEMGKVDMRLETADKIASALGLHICISELE